MINTLEDGKVTGKVMIVDDEEDHIKILGKLLRRNGYAVHVANNSTTALTAIHFSHPDIILLDIMMPEVNGFEICMTLKNNPKTKDIPIIFISALHSVEDKIRAFRVGGIDYIEKPFDEKEVIARINTQLNLAKYYQIILNQHRILHQHALITTTDLNGTINYVSQAYCDLIGYTEDEMLGETHNILHHPETTDDMVEEIWSTLLADACWSGEIKNLRKDGSYFWVKAFIEPVYDTYGEKIGYSSIKLNITEKKQIEYLAITDELTGLYNRRHFNDLSKRIYRHSKREKLWFNFIILDIDYFKQYNDTYGHSCGDKALQKIAIQLKQKITRASDYAFRLGGEEFGILTCTKNQHDVIVIAERLRKSVEELEIKHEKNTVSQYVTISLGVFSTSAVVENISIDTIYIKADKALYKAKNDGRNRVVLYTEL